MQLDTPIILTQLCDADLRRSPGFAELANKVTLTEAIELHAEMEKRRAALHGGPFSEENK